MAARIPQMPPLDPNRPDEAFRQITAWGNDVRLALESRQAAMEGLTLNPDSPLWAGRNLPGIPVLPVPVPTGFQAWGVYDAIQLVWDLQPDPAIDGYELLRDSAIIDFVRANCYTDIPIGDLDAHTYELRTVRVGDGWRSAGVTATATAQTDEATIRANHDAAFLGHQTAAMARNAATDVFSIALSDTISTTSTSYVDMPSTSISVTTPGGVPILILAVLSYCSIFNNTGFDSTSITADVRLRRETTTIQAGHFGGPAYDTQNIEIPIVLAIVESPAAGTYTYKMQYSVDDTLYTLQVSSRSLQAMVFKR